MKVLVLGCGEMGTSAIADLYHYSEFKEIIIATRRLENVKNAISGLTGKAPKITPVELQVEDHTELVNYMKRADVVVNCVGPNYKTEVPIAKAAIEAKVNLVDINDDYETTFEMLQLDDQAKDAGITIILGMGASPGVNNILVAAAADQLDVVEKIHTAWIMSGTDPGGLALSYHLLYSLSHKALTFQDGQMIEVQSFVDGREPVEFPEPVGVMDVFHIGHPEPITLSRTYKDVKYVDDKASFNPPLVNDWIVSLGKIAREAPGPIRVGRHIIEPMDFAASLFHQKCRSLKNYPKQGGLRVKVEGQKDGKPKKIFFSSAARIAQGTGIPASIGAIMLTHEDIYQKGVLPPEACVNPHDFIYEIVNRRNVAKLNGWVE